MATRNLTKAFEALRAERAHLHQRSGDQHNGDSVLLKSDETGVDVPPEWVDIVESIQFDIAAIKKNMDKLADLHGARLKVTFDEPEAQQEQMIQIQTQEIQRLFRKCENNLKRIATVGNPRGAHLPTKERVVRLNVMRGLASEISDLSKAFRTAQKDYAKRLDSQSDVATTFFTDDGDSKQSMTLEEYFAQGNMSAQSQAQLDDMMQRASSREKEILRIAQSVNDLAQIFKELSLLVVEQGTVLDRIDYNITATLDHVQEANRELVKADKAMSSKAIICIAILLILVIILTLVLVFKKQ